MNLLPIYYVLPHPDGGWCFTRSLCRWPSELRKRKAYPSAIDAMDAAYLKPDVMTRRQIVWQTKEQTSNGNHTPTVYPTAP